MSVEFHCHTLFSVDARGTPEQLVDVAAERGIRALAVTEHNNLGSLERARARAAERGIRYLPGVEIDGGVDGAASGAWYHFVCLGFDPEDAALRALLEKNFSCYEANFDLYLEGLRDAGYEIERDDIVSRLAERYPTHPSPVPNQWFARTILLERGVFPDAKAGRDAVAAARQKILASRGADAFRRMSPLESVRDAVHGAGGVILLAHVANYRAGDLAGQVALIREMLDEGIDGFELYHPQNMAEPHFADLIAEARRIGCPVSGGSDCHDAPSGGEHALGSADVPDDVLEGIERALERKR